MRDKIASSGRLGALFGRAEQTTVFQRAGTDEVRRTQLNVASEADVVSVSGGIMFAVQSKETFDLASISRNTELWRQFMSSYSHQARLREKAPRRLSRRSNLAISTCMDIVRNMVRSGRTRTARQYLHETIDDLLRRGQHATIEALLFSTNPTEDDPRVLITLLTATKPAKDLIRSRPEFYRQVVEAITRRNLDEPGLFEGLD